MILLVHSCDKRSWIWDHWQRFFDLSGWDAEVRWIKGNEQFSDQLKTALESITDEYVWYTLDDFFISEPIDWKHYEKLAVKHKVDALRVQPNVRMDALPYRFEKFKDGLLKQLPHSEYTMSMQASIWRREYFLECLTPGLNPWQLENAPLKRFGNVYFVSDLGWWYTDGTKHGVYRARGRKMVSE